MKLNIKYDKQTERNFVAVEWTAANRRKNVLPAEFWVHMQVYMLQFGQAKVWDNRLGTKAFKIHRQRGSLCGSLRGYNAFVRSKLMYVNMNYNADITDSPYNRGIAFYFQCLWSIFRVIVKIIINLIRVIIKLDRSGCLVAAWMSTWNCLKLRVKFTELQGVSKKFESNFDRLLCTKY